MPLCMKWRAPTVCFPHMGINPYLWDASFIRGILYKITIINLLYMCQVTHKNTHSHWINSIFLTENYNAMTDVILWIGGSESCSSIIICILAPNINLCSLKVLFTWLFLLVPFSLWPNKQWHFFFFFFFFFKKKKKNKNKN